MKRWLWMLGIVAMMASLVTSAVGPANAATPEEIENSVQAGQHGRY